MPFNSLVTHPPFRQYWGHHPQSTAQQWGHHLTYLTQGWGHHIPKSSQPWSHHVQIMSPQWGCPNGGCVTKELNSTLCASGHLVQKICIYELGLNILCHWFRCPKNVLIWNFVLEIVSPWLFGPKNVQLWYLVVPIFSCWLFGPKNVQIWFLFLQFLSQCLLFGILSDTYQKRSKTFSIPTKNVESTPWSIFVSFLKKHPEISMNFQKLIFSMHPFCTLFLPTWCIHDIMSLSP